MSCACREGKIGLTPRGEPRGDRPETGEAAEGRSDASVRGRKGLKEGRWWAGSGEVSKGRIESLLRVRVSAGPKRGKRWCWTEPCDWAQGGAERRFGEGLTLSLFLWSSREVPPRPRARKQLSHGLRATPHHLRRYDNGPWFPPPLCTN